MNPIAILVPVLSRPQRVEPLLASIHAASETDPRVVFVCSPGDQAEIDACLATEADTIIVTWDPGPGDYARKINLAFRHTTEPWVFQAADDLEFHAGWDVEALAEAERAGALVVGTNDLGNPQTRRGLHSTHTLVSRTYVEFVGATFDGPPGVLLHEGYDHQYVDTELVAAAKARGRWGWARGSVVEHLHPLWGKANRDATYEKALARGADDFRMFRDRQRAFRAREAAAA